MSILDWIVLIGTLFTIVAYGTWKTRGIQNIDGYLKGSNTMKWGTIGLSIMATQASAITFLSTPGMAYENNLTFVQNYFAVPIALIIVSAVFLPIYYKLKVFTAYEFLEQRFDYKSRALAALIFLIQRGLAAGITIYAPAIILSKALGFDLNTMVLLVGVVVIMYTVFGGTKAVNLTQKYQMIVIFLGMFLAFFILIYKLPEFLSVGDALHVAGKMGKLETLDFSFDFGNRYTIWSGIFGAIFLSLSYFGADQSQVQRYLGGKNITEIRTGLMFNALLKIPMQFFILLLGVFVFIFYQFERPPVFFNHNELEQLKISVGEESVNTIDDEYGKIHLLKQDKIKELVIAMDAPGEDQGMVDHKVEELMALENQSKALRVEVKDMMLKNDPDATTKDYDYVFITFVMTYLPKGVIGLLIAVILSAAMSSVSSELNALGSTTVIDFYKRSFKKDGDEKHYVLASRLFTMFWGIIAIIFALTASLVENLIEFVNIVGSVFYGTVLGIFLVAFFIKFVKGNALFIAALISQTTVIILHYLTTVEIIKLGYLWYNMIGCLLLILLSVLLQLLMTKKNNI